MGALEAFVEERFDRELRPGNVLVLDNVRAHQPERIRKLVEAARARPLFLPPDTPDVDPVEFG